MKKEALDILEQIIGNPEFTLKHLDALERIQQGLPEEEDDKRKEEWPPTEHDWYPGDFEKQYPSPDWDPGLKEHIKPPYLHEIQKILNPDSPTWEDSDYSNIARLKKR
jgi:hypothetical protein